MKATEIQAILKSLPAKDKETAARLKNKGRPRLTLHHLHALRKQWDALRLERKIHLQRVRDMYGPDAALEEGYKEKPTK